MKNLFILFGLILIGCNSSKCDIIDPNFRPHRVYHYNKSKIYIYYHMTPCVCSDITHDLCLDCYYQKDHKDFVEFLDTKQKIYGR